MIRLNERVGEIGPVLWAEGRGVHGDPDPVSITSGEMSDGERRKQVALLIDAAAGLLEHDDDCVTHFEALHAVLEALPE